MGSQFGYDFYFTIDGEVLTLPITPSEVSISSGSNNKTVTLINEGEVNILKSPSLMEIEFDARFPMREYPFSRWKKSTNWDYKSSQNKTVVWDSAKNFEYYFNKFTKVKENKQPFRFTIVRSTPSGQLTWGTGLSKDLNNNLFSLEELSTKESADDGDDVIVSFKLKKYKKYGVKHLPTSAFPTTTSTSKEPRSDDNKTKETKTYTVKPGDCLWNIAKAEYGNGAKYTVIYNANKTVIENTANKYRKGKGSSNGHWIYSGTKLVIPAL